MKTPCRYPGCRALLDKSGYCERHQASAPKRHRLYDRHVRQRDPALALAARIRNSVRWRNVRAQKLAEFPMCEDPLGHHGRQGTTRTAEQVHHIEGLIDRPDLAYTQTNLMSVCMACHAALERGVRASASAKGQGRPEASHEQDGPAFG
jgi:hypothetical protein